VCWYGYKVHIELSNNTNRTVCTMALTPLLLLILQLLCTQIEAFTSNNIKSNISDCAQHYNNGGGESKDYTRKSIILYAQTKSVDVCIVGGGISGLAAAITTTEKAKQQPQQQSPSILILVIIIIITIITIQNVVP